jgi:hypothetical protein
VVQIARLTSAFPGRKARTFAGFLFLCATLSGCSLILPQTEALKEQHPPDLPVRAEVADVPFFPQKDYQCGPAALAMALNAAHTSVTPDELIDQVYIPARKGSLQIEMLASARRHGLVAYELAPELTDVLKEIAAGTPVIVLENYGFRIYPIWHYAVALGYDLDTAHIVRHSGVYERQLMPFAVFEYIWKDDGHWAMVAVPPERVPATATEPRYSSAVIALEKTGQTKSAFTAYKALLERWPDSLAGRMGLGNTAYALHDLDTAESAFKEAAQDHPDSAAAFNNLAQLLAERGELDAAITAAETAVALGGPLLTTTQATLEEIRQKAVNHAP